MGLKQIITCGICGTENNIISDCKIKSFVCKNHECEASITIGKTEITAKEIRPCVSVETDEMIEATNDKA